MFWAPFWTRLPRNRRPALKIEAAIFYQPAAFPAKAGEAVFLFPYFNPNSEVTGGGGADDALSECARPGRSNWLHSSHRTFPNRPPTSLGCGRDDRTPPTQKFNFGVRIHLPHRSGATKASAVWVPDTAPGARVVSSRSSRLGGKRLMEKLKHTRRFRERCGLGQTALRIRPGTGCRGQCPCGVGPGQNTDLIMKLTPIMRSSTCSFVGLPFLWCEHRLRKSPSR